MQDGSPPRSYRTRNTGNSGARIRFVHWATWGARTGSSPRPRAWRSASRSSAAWAFLHAGGTIEERTLAPGEVLRVDTGCIVGLAKTVNYDIEMVKGVKSWIFGGEGLFFATLHGPGRVWLQSLPLSRLAGRIFAAAPQRGGRKEEGSFLGGLGNLLDGSE